MIPSSTPIRLRFWGVRGSLPTPGPSTVRYGGNTSCVSLDGTRPDGQRWYLILDAGTGIRELGREVVQTEADIFLMLTHAHWDHIQGFPFFDPIYQVGGCMYLVPGPHMEDAFDLLLGQIDGRRFPLRREQIPAAFGSIRLGEVEEGLYDARQVQLRRVNHPGPTYGIRVQAGSSSVVYIPDNEIDPPYDPIATFDDLVAFCQGAHVLIHDAQYLDAELEHRAGWGHSSIAQTVALAQAAEVEHLVLFHHDPSRTDDTLDAIQAHVNQLTADGAYPVRCTVAYEGLSVALEPLIRTATPPQG
ncbi:MAG: MBL fold metallo-hydrolase [Rhodothermales bacterium]